MDEEFNTQWLLKVIEQCSWINNTTNPIEQVVELLIEDAIPKGFNYSGRLLRLTAKIKQKSGEEKQISLILKLKPLNQDQCDFITEHGLFTTETQTYDAVLSKMEQLIVENGLRKELDWPKHYTINHENLLLLEDLKITCHSTIKQREATYEEGVEVLEALGRFHAMSRVLVEQGSIDIDKYQVNNMAESETINQFVYLSSIRAIVDAVKTTQQSEWYNIASFIEANLNKIGPALKELVVTNKGRYDVLNHGDCWLNNIMFKYNSDTNKPSGIKLIDFQLCYYNSFAWDLAHFLYCSYLVEKRENLKYDLISKYRKSLLLSLQIFKSKDLNVLSVEEMLMSLEKVNLFGTLCALATIPRLVTGINVELDLDITLPDHAHKEKTAVFAQPQVFKHVTADLNQLYKLMEKF